MTLRPRQFLLIGLPIVLLLFFGVGGWLRSTPPKSLDIRTNLPQNRQVVLGAPISCVARIQTSWRERPTGALRLELPEGVTLAPDAGIRLQTIGWGVARWYVLAEIRATQPGPVPACAMHVPLRSPGTELRLELPAFTAVLPTLDSPDPEVAPLPSPPPSRWLGGIVVLLVAGLIWYLVYRQRHPRETRKPPAPSSSSLRDRLERLRDRLAEPDAALFGELCDLVAEHLQKAYAVPATGLTLREQAAWLSQTQVLSARLAEPLVGFWRQAEEIRFAGQTATPEQAEAAFRAAAALLAQGRRASA